MKLCFVDVESTPRCISAECTRQAVTRQLCHPHYKRWLRSGSVPEGSVGGLHGRRYAPTCSVGECDRKHVAKGLCSKHYQRLQATGDPLSPGRDWDGKCKRCQSDGPFLKGLRVCNSCRGIDQSLRREGDLERYRAYGRESARRNHARRRQAALAAYGGKCACCATSEVVFLVIDHVNGGGNKHRRSLSPSGRMVGSARFYRWLEQNRWPDGFQILCHNCNFAKSNGGCPHGNC
jgi:hypothetical protein